ncbi:MAG: leucine--tRNA ligase, partial [Alphaproteobacteria bacterium]|nr:leucine--tRNA ligase [Alphaproteobacteria bacterium]
CKSIFTRQLKKLGYSFDWDRVVSTTDPDFVKWTQWMFLKFYKSGLAYKADSTINWCDHCKRAWTNEELEGGNCERCKGPVEQRVKSQWTLKMQDYSEKLLEGLETVDYSESIKTSQQNWIGKSVGAEIDFKINLGEEKLSVFTTRADTCFGVTFMAVCPEHELLTKYMSSFGNAEEVKSYIDEARHKTDLERQIAAGEAKVKTGVEIQGLKAINPFNGKEIPVFVADYVLSGYGTGAIMAVPAHDQRDYDFAKAYNLDIVPVLEGGNIEEEAWTQEGAHINSEFLNGMGKQEAIDAAISFLEEKECGKKAINYKMGDWLFTRQRYWGEPIPMINCPKCGWVTVPEKELPLELPEMDEFLPTDDADAPLARATDWVNCTCPKCGESAKRETDTMPGWAGSSWYFLRYMDPNNDDAFASQEALDYWGKVDWYNGGQEHTTRHLLYSRFWYKALRDAATGDNPNNYSYLKDDDNICTAVLPEYEPYNKRTFQGLILGSNGEKMSKSRGNVVNPDDVIAEYGADALRIYEMFIGPFEQAVAWNENSLVGVFRFLKRVWAMQDKLGDVELSDKDENVLHSTIKNVSERVETNSHNTVISALMEMLNYMADKDVVSKEMYAPFIQMLSLYAPHISEEIWEVLGNKESIAFACWPKYDEDKTKSSTVTIGVQVMGKLRSEVELAPDASEDDAKELALSDPKVQKFIEGKTVRKFIYVPGRIINIVAN